MSPNPTHPPQAAELSAAKRALLELRLKKGRKPGAPDPIPRRAQRDLVPLSYAQELLWLLDQLNPNMSVYSVPRAMRIRGPLDVGILRRVLDTIVARHEVLRTTFVLVNDQPVQKIAATGTVEWRQADLRALPAEEQEREVQRLLTEEARRPFDLGRDPMFRATLLALGEQDHALYLGTHHIASDGWSKSVLFAELRALYEAFTAGRPSPLPEPPIQYADFALWQREQLREEVMAKQLAYWKQQLAGAPALLDLPTDYPRPTVQTFRGSFVRLVFPKPLADAFKALGQKEGTTLFMTLLAAFDAFMARYTGQTDLVFGTPIAGRNRPEFEPLLGYFTNTLTLRSDVSGNPTFRELLQRVKHMALAAYEHQDLPFEKLIVELKPERDLSYSPVFQVLFSVGHVGAMVPELPGLQVEPIALDRGITKFDLTVGITDRDDGLAVAFEYNTDLFGGATIGRMMAGFRTLLEGIVADPDCRVNDLPLLPEAERRQLLRDWNATQADFPRHCCVHELVADQARRAPAAPAVIYPGGRLTYAELDARANQLAHYLRRRGVGPDVLVGLCAGRSAEMAVGLLGILKAGGAYVPLDPAYPKGRLDAMLEDTRPAVVLTQQRLLRAGSLSTLVQESGGSRPPLAVVCLDADWPALSRESTAPPDSGARPDNLAYVMFTSGSTGRPRGVLVPHRGLANHNAWAVKEFALTPADRVLQFSSLSFDIAVEEIFPTWVAGATLVLRRDDAALAGPVFLRWVREQGVTVLDLPTAFWHEWVGELAARRAALPEALRLVIVGGEKAQAAAYATWRRLSGGRVRWLNTYGPTEATVVATAYAPPADEAAPATEIPIGRPIANTQAYVVDPALRPVPVGVPGELLLGGTGVARGYLNRPELTAEKFIPDPFAGEGGGPGGGKLYRTGDRVRWRPDGTLEFLGRVDRQVKIRGFRVEPEEVEAVLATHPAVREAAVAVREDVPGDRRLAAYVVPDPAAGPTAEELRGYLRQRLPEYMVPAAFVLLAALPRTPNGKLGLQALPAPGPAAAQPAAGSAAPRDPLESQLCLLWERLLGVRPVGRTDNFFELGGHSLLAVRLFSQIERLFGLSLPLVALFRAPTVEQLADLLRQDPHTYSWPTLFEIQPAGSRLPLFCAAAPNVNALGYAFLARRLGPDQPLYGLQARFREQSPEAGGLYTQAEYEALACEYAAAMRAVQPQGPYHLAGMCEGAHIAFEMARQLRADGQKVALLAILDAWPIENSTSPFFWYVFYNRRRLRAFWRRPARQKLADLWDKARSLVARVPRLLRPARGPAAPRPVNSYEARKWPGKDFRPPVFDGKITVFRARRQPYWRVRDFQLGWGPWAAGGVEVHVVNGEHQMLLREPYVRVVAEGLRACMEQARQGGAAADDRHAGRACRDLGVAASSS